MLAGLLIGAAVNVVAILLVRSGLSSTSKLFRRGR